MNKPLSLLYIAMFVAPSIALAQSPESGVSQVKDIEVIEVINLRTKLEQAGRLKDVIQQTRST